MIFISVALHHHAAASRSVLILLMQDAAQLLLQDLLQVRVHQQEVSQFIIAMEMALLKNYLPYLQFTNMVQRVNIMFASQLKLGYSMPYPELLIPAV